MAKPGRKKIIIDWAAFNEALIAQASIQDAADYLGVSYNTIIRRFYEDKKKTKKYFPPALELAKDCENIEEYKRRLKTKGKVRLRILQNRLAEQLHPQMLIHLGKTELNQVPTERKLIGGEMSIKTEAWAKEDNPFIKWEKEIESPFLENDSDYTDYEEIDD